MVHANRPEPIQMTDDVWMIDLMEQGVPYRTGAYVILDEEPTLIETGSANSHDLLVLGLKQIGLSPRDLSYVAVTHVHLDHAGGAGQMMRVAENAKLLVHPRGARHMANPSKLWAGAMEVYGDKTVAMFGEVMPVDEAQIQVQEHQSKLDIGKRTLTFFDSPGHAKHHFTILDPVTDALFAGDAVGIRYPKEFTSYDFEFVMPSSSPIDFDPVALHQTLDMLREVPFQYVYHAHYGRTPKMDAIMQMDAWADVFSDFIGRVYHAGISLEEVIDLLRQQIAQTLQAQGKHPGDIRKLDIDVLLDAMGLIYYEQKRQA